MEPCPWVRCVCIAFESGRLTRVWLRCLLLQIAAARRRHEQEQTVARERRRRRQVLLQTLQGVRGKRVAFVAGPGGVAGRSLSEAPSCARGSDGPAEAGGAEAQGATTRAASAVAPLRARRGG